MTFDYALSNLIFIAPLIYSESFSNRLLYVWLTRSACVETIWQPVCASARCSFTFNLSVCTKVYCLRYESLSNFWFLVSMKKIQKE